MSRVFKEGRPPILGAHRVSTHLTSLHTRHLPSQEVTHRQQYSIVKLLSGLMNKDGSFCKGGILYKGRFISALLPVGIPDRLFPELDFLAKVNLCSGGGPEHR